MKVVVKNEDFKISLDQITNITAINIRSDTWSHVLLSHIRTHCHMRTACLCPPLLLYPASSGYCPLLDPEDRETQNQNQQMGWDTHTHAHSWDGLLRKYVHAHSSYLPSPSLCLFF